MGDLFTPHEVEWTRERVRRFWAYFAASPHADRTYFSSHTGDAIVAFTQRRVPLRNSRVLDYGCGSGFLLERLLRRGVRAEGLEFSEESANRARGRCAGHALFGGVTFADGVPSPIESASVDVVFLVEVLEHLPPPQVGQTLEDIRRILRMGGFLVATTPNNEDIERLKTICPDCGCIFHHWQHVASFSVGTLPGVMSRHGMETIICRATTLGGRWPGKLIRFLRRTFAGSEAAGTHPYLVYIGRRVA